MNEIQGKMSNSWNSESSSESDSGKKKNTFLYEIEMLPLHMLDQAQNDTQGENLNHTHNTRFKLKNAQANINVGSLRNSKLHRYQTRSQGMQNIILSHWHHLYF